MEDRGLEPLTSCMPCKRSPDLSETLSEVTSTPSARCTPRCTENGNEPNTDPLAGFVASLTPADRARLVALLTGQQEGSDPSKSTGETSGMSGEGTEP